jgi:vitamin B12 transporter
VVLASGLALIGVERLDQKVGSNDTAYVVNSRTIDSAFAGWVKNSDVHNFQFNLRRDQNSQFGGKSTGLLGYGMRLTPEWQVKTSWGTGFKAPTFNDLYYPYGGNSALKPETSVNREFAVHRDQQDSHFAVIHYVNSINNLIQWIPINLDIYSPQNVASATINGWTFTYKDQFAGYRWGASLDLQDPKDNTLQKTLYYRSRETAKFNVEKDFASLNLGAEWMASVRRYADTDNQQVLGGYGLLNLYGGYKISNDIAVTFRLNNALDKKYSLSQGYAMPGINWFTGLRFNLN